MTKERHLHQMMQEGVPTSLRACAGRCGVRQQNDECLFCQWSATPARMLTPDTFASGQLNDGGDAALLMRKGVSGQSHQLCRATNLVLYVTTVLHVEVHASTVDRIVGMYSKFRQS